MPTIAIVTNAADGIFQRTVIAGALGALRAPNVTVRIDDLPYPTDHYDLNGADGVLMIHDVLTDAVVCGLHQRGVPLALVGHLIPGSGIAAVMSQDDTGMTRLIDHLISVCGRRQFVFIQGLAGKRDSEARERAVIEALMRANLPAPVLLRGDFDPDIATATLTAFLTAPTPSFDALVAADYVTAGAALTVLRTRGLRVPADVSVAGFGDADDAAALGLTTVSANVSEQGRRGALLVMAQVHGQSITGTTLIQTDLVIRATCGGA